LAARWGVYVLPRPISHNAGLLQRTGRYEKEGRRGAKGKRPTYKGGKGEEGLLLKGTERREKGREERGG